MNNLKESIWKGSIRKKSLNSAKKTARLNSFLLILFSASLILPPISGSASVVDTEDPKWVEERINRQKKILRNTEYPEYTTLSGMLSDDYDELWFTGVEYHKLSLKAINLAEQKFEQGEIDTAHNLVQKSLKYEYLSREAFSGANAVRAENLEKAQTIARRISTSCQVAMEVILETTGHPALAKGVDYLFLFTEESTKYVLSGQSPDIRKDIQKIIIKETFDRIHWDELGGYLSDFAKEKTGKLYPIIEDLVGSEKWKKELMKSLSQEISEEKALGLINRIENKLEESP